MTKLLKFIFTSSFKGWVPKILPLVLIILMVLVGFIVGNSAQGAYEDGENSKYQNYYSVFKTIHTWMTMASIVLISTYVCFVSVNIFNKWDEDGLSILMSSKPIAVWKVILSKYIFIYTIVIVFSFVCSVIPYSIIGNLLEDENFKPSNYWLSQFVGSIIFTSLISSVAIMMSSLKTSQVLTIITGGIVVLAVLGMMTKALGGRMEDTWKEMKNSLYMDKNGNIKEGSVQDQNGEDSIPELYSYDKLQKVDVFSQWDNMYSLFVDDNTIDSVPVIEKQSSTTAEPVYLFQENDDGKIVKSSFVWTLPYKKNHDTGKITLPKESINGIKKFAQDHSALMDEFTSAFEMRIKISEQMEALAKLIKADKYGDKKLDITHVPAAYKGVGTGKTPIFYFCMENKALKECPIGAKPAGSTDDNSGNTVTRTSDGKYLIDSYSAKKAIEASYLDGMLKATFEKIKDAIKAQLNNGKNNNPAPPKDDGKGKVDNQQPPQLDEMIQGEAKDKYIASIQSYMFTKAYYDYIKLHPQSAGSKAFLIKNSISSASYFDEFFKTTISEYSGAKRALYVTKNTASRSMFAIIWICISLLLTGFTIAREFRRDVR